jgi:uncharacterized protein
MELNGEVAISAARQRVWTALNDPEVLARCIEGVETLTRVADNQGTRFEGKMHARVGPVRATFTGQVTLTDVVAPERYVLIGEGKGGVAGFAKGEAAVTLTETGPGTTRLVYAVKSSVGGKLAQLGARLIEGTAKAYAEGFFARLKLELEGPAAAPFASEPPAEAVPVITAPGPAADSAPGPATGLSPLLWGGMLVAAVLAFLLWQWA